MDDIAYLITQKHIADENLVQHPAEEQKRPIYVSVFSIGRNDYYAAGQLGLVPDFRLDTFYLDYNGEEELEFRGQRYHIDRSYLVPNTERVELTVRKVLGTHGT